MTKIIKKEPRKLSNLTRRYNENPFIGSRAEYKRSKKRTVIKGGKMIVDSETGEVEDMAEITQVHEVDSERFVKLYTAHLKQIFSLKSSALQMLQVVLTQVQENVGKDTILLNVKIMEKYFTSIDVKPVSPRTFYRAIDELISKAFIAPSADSRDLFFINPNLFFNGDRVRIVNEYHVTKQMKMFDDTDLAFPKLETGE